jgi:carbon storage regulator
MLVLSRKIGEVITVGNNVTVTVLSYDRGVVRLGIDAPKSVDVHRKEIYDKIIALNKKAVKTQRNAIKSMIGKTNFSADERTKLEIRSINYKSNEK